MRPARSLPPRLLLTALLITPAAPLARADGIEPLIAQWRSTAYADREAATRRILAGWTTWTPADLARLAAAARDADAEVARRAAGVLPRLQLRRRIGQPLWEAAPGLEVGLRARREDAIYGALARAAARHLAGTLPAEAFAPLLALAAEPGHAALARAALRVARASRLPAVARLAVPLLSHGDATVRREASALYLACGAGEATPALRQLLDLRERDTPSNAISALALSTDGAALEALAASVSPRMRGEIAWTFTRAPRRDGRALCLKLLDDPDAGVRGRAAQALAGYRDARVLAAQHRRLAADTTQTVRYEIMRGLEQQGGADLTVVLPLLDDPDPLLASAAMRVVGAWGTSAHAPALARHVVALAADPRGRSSVPGALVALARIAGPAELRVIAAQQTAGNAAIAVTATRLLLRRALVDDDPAALGALLGHARADIREAVVRALTTVAHGPRSRRRLYAPTVEVPGWLAARIPQAALTGRLADPSPRVRQHAVKLLGERRAREAAAQLLALIADADADVALEAGEALGRLGARDVIEPLRRLSQAPATRWPAVAALHALGARIPVETLAAACLDARSALARQILQRTPQPDRAALAQLVLARIQAAPEARRGSLLMRRRDLLEGLTSQTLLPLLSSPRMRRTAIGLLGRAPDPAALDRLLALAAGDDASDRTAALSALQTRYRSAPAPAPAVRQRLAALLAHADAKTRAQAVHLARQTQVDVEAIAGRLTDDEAIVRAAAIQALATRLAPDAYRRRVGPSLKDPDTDVRRLAARQLARLGDPAAIGVLEDWLKRETRRFPYEPIALLAGLGRPEHLWRHLSWTALSADYRADHTWTVNALGPQTAWLIGALGDRDERTAANAWFRIALQKGGDHPERLVALLGDPRGRVRASASRILGRLGHRADAVAGIARLLDDPRHDVRQRAVVDLGRLGAVEHAARVAALAADARPALREAALRALGRMAASAQRAVVARGLGDRSRAVRLAAAEALSRLPGAEAAAPLVPLLSEDDPGLRRAAVEGLMRLDAGLEAALRRLPDEPDDGVHRALCRLLGRRGGAAALPALARELSDRPLARHADLLRAAARILLREPPPAPALRTAWTAHFASARVSGWPALNAAGIQGQAALERDPERRAARLAEVSWRHASEARFVTDDLAPAALSDRLEPVRDVRSLADLQALLRARGLRIEPLRALVWTGRAAAGRPTSLRQLIDDHVRYLMRHHDRKKRWVMDVLPVHLTVADGVLQLRWYR